MPIPLKPHKNNSILYDPGDEEEEVQVNQITNCISDQSICWCFSKAAIDDIVQGRSTEKEEAQVGRISFILFCHWTMCWLFPKIILDSINRKISIREQERAGLIFRGPQLGNALGPDQAACAGPISKNVPSAVDELEWSLLLCGIRSSDLPDITNVSVPREPVRAKGPSFVTDELERLFLLYNPAASGSTSTSATSDSLGQPGPAPIATSTASSPGHLSPATTPPLRRHTWKGMRGLNWRASENRDGWALKHGISFCWVWNRRRVLMEIIEGNKPIWNTLFLPI